MVPRRVFWTRSGDGERRRVDRMQVYSTDDAYAARQNRWFRLKITDPVVFRGSAVGFGFGSSSHNGSFYLPDEGGAGTRISRLTYDGTRLRVRLLRDRATMDDDLSSRYQELELAFDASGRPHSMTLWNYDHVWERGTTIDATLPAEVDVWEGRMVLQ
jgi:hypothetical protein